MDSTIVGLIITGVIALILLSSVLWGIKRGMKKTLFRLGWLVVTAIILFFTVPPLSGWLNSFDLSSFNLDICGKVTKLSDIGVNIVNSIEGGKDALESSVALTTFVENLPTMILNIFLFVVLFWLLKAILWVVWAPIASRLFDKQKRELKKFKKQQRKIRRQNKGLEFVKEEAEPLLLRVKENKHRAWGAVFGFVLGLVLCAVTFSPIIGLNAIYKTAYVSIKSQDENGNEIPYLSQVLDDETRGYIQSYEDSIGSKILKYSGVEFVSNLMFGSLATVQVGEEKVSLADEINAVSNVLNSVESIRTFDGENVTQESVENLIINIRKIFKDLDDSKIIYLLGDQLVPYFLNDYLDNSETVLIDGDMLDKVIKDAYFEFSNHFDFKALKNQLVSVLDVASELNGNNLLVPILNGEVSGAEQIFSLIGNNVTNISKFADTIVDAFYNISILQNNYPELVCAALESLFNELGIEYTEQTIDAQKLRNDVNSLLNKFVYFCRYYSKNDRLDFGNYTTDIMTTAGGVLNIVKEGLISEDNFSALVDFAKTEINKALTEVVDLTSLVESIKSVDDWENELKSLATIYKSIVKLVNAEPTEQKIMSGEFDDYIANIGKGFDSAVTGQSILVNNENIKTALKAFVAKLDTSSFDELLNIEVDGTTTLEQQLYKNIFDTELKTSKIKKWENELKYNLAVVKLAYNINNDGFDLDKLSSPDNTQLTEIGAAIDECLERTNLILSNKTIRSVFDYYLGKIELPQEVADILNIETEVDGKKLTILQVALNNIYNKSNGYENPYLSYEYELSKIKNVLTVDFANATFVEFGAALDNLSGSGILSKNSVINVVVAHFIDEETSSLDSGLKTALEKMKANLKNVTSYAKEIEYIEDLLEVLDANYENDTQKFEAFGHQFNIMCDYNDTIGTSSKLFDKQTINSFITYYFDEYVGNNLKEVSQDIKDIVNSVKSNLHLIHNYEKELVNFLNLADYVDGTIVDVNGDHVQDAKDIGYYLDNMSSDIITTSVVKNLIAYYINEESKSLNTNLKNIVSDITTTVKNQNTVIESYEKEFDLLLKLVAEVEKSTVDTIEVGKVFDKIQAESNIVTRATLEKFVKYFFDDFVATNLSSADDAALKQIVEGIANNIVDINSFEKEFKNLDMLFDVVNMEDKTEVALVFDQISLTNSQLIKEDPNMHSMVSYFFDKYVSTNLDAQEDAKLIEIINGIKANIKNIESYKKEFDNLELLFNNVNNADTTAIGAILNQIVLDNSKLIKKDPNMFDIVSFFFDKYIEERLDAQNDAELIEIVNGIKNNVNQIESFEKEFDYLELLLDNVDNPDKKAIGAIFDQLVSEGCKLIQKDPNLTDLVAYFFDDYVKTNLNEDNDAKLIEIVEGIKANISDIESFEFEFGNLDLLFENINSTDKKQIGKTLDELEASNSKLIKRDPNINALVEYFFDDYVKTNLDAHQDAGLISAINGIKANVSSVESFELEFENLDGLFDKVKNGTNTEIGAYFDVLVQKDSKLIKKDPNMFDLVNYFFDDYVETKLNAEDDAKLIEVVNGIKSNVTQIESFAGEFANLDLLFDKVNSTNKSEIGDVFDQIILAESNLIKENPNIQALVSYFFDDYVKTNLNVSTDAGLINIVNNVKKNISLIESYKKEFSNLEKLFSALTSSSNSEIGEILDEINGNSNLISSQNTNDIVLYFFDKNTKDYKTDYSSTILQMRAKVENATNYKTMFTELDTVMDNFDTLANIDSIDAFKNAENVGYLIDNMAKMTEACDKNVAYTIAEVVFDELLTIIEDEISPLLKTQVEEIMNNETFSFDTYNPADQVEYAGSHADENYYKDLVDIIKSSLPSF